VGINPGDKLLCEWLVALDLDEMRSRKKGELTGFADLIERFEDEGIQTLDDLLTVGVEGLRGKGWIKLATLSWIMAFAREDMKEN
jgi:hypothetical protein